MNFYPIDLQIRKAAVPLRKAVTIKGQLKRQYESEKVQEIQCLCVWVASPGFPGNCS